MKNNPNFFHEDILQRIAELKALKAQQELTISMNYYELMNSLTPEKILQDSIQHLSTNRDTQKNLATMAVKAGTNFVIEKLFGTNNSIKGFIGSMIAEKVSNSFIGSMISKI